MNFLTRDNVLGLYDQAQQVIFNYLTANNFSNQGYVKFSLQHINNFDYINNQTLETQVNIFNYLAQNNFNTQSTNFVNQMINLSNTNNSTFVFDNTINSSNAINVNNTTEYQNYLNNFANAVSEELSSITIGDTKTARFKKTVNLFTDFNVEVNQTMNPYSINNVSSSLSGNTLGLTYEQTTDGSSAEVSTNGNVVTVTFSANLNFVLFTEGIGTIHTFHLTIVVKINRLTGEPISIVIYGLP